jgi:hypothetical protein
MCSVFVPAPESPTFHPLKSWAAEAGSPSPPGQNHQLPKSKLKQVRKNPTKSPEPFPPLGFAWIYETSLLEYSWSFVFWCTVHQLQCFSPEWPVAGDSELGACPADRFWWRRRGCQAPSIDLLGHVSMKCLFPLGHDQSIPDELVHAIGSSCSSLFLSNSWSWVNFCLGNNALMRA